MNVEENAVARIRVETPKQEPLQEYDYWRERNQVDIELSGAGPRCYVA